MAYQTGSATNVENLLDTIRGFVLSMGWTVNFWGNDPNAASGKWLSVATVGGNYFNLVANTSLTSLSVRGALGYSGSSNRDAQGGQAPLWATTNGLSGPFAAYYLFGGSDYLHIVIEVVTNRFAHIHIGVMEKAGNFVGGEYQSNTWWQYGNTAYQNQPDSGYNAMPFDSIGIYAGSLAQYYRFDTDGATANWQRNNTNNGNGNSTVNHPKGFMRSGSLVHRMIARTPNYLNAQPILIPSIITGPRPAGGTAIYGSIKDLRGINIATLSPKEILTIGSDQWMVFPVIRKGGGTIYEAVSGNYGLAYRKVT